MTWETEVVNWELRERGIEDQKHETVDRLRKCGKVAGQPKDLHVILGPEF